MLHPESFQFSILTKRVCCCSRNWALPLCTARNDILDYGVHRPYASHTNKALLEANYKCLTAVTNVAALLTYLRPGETGIEAIVCKT